MIRFRMDRKVWAFLLCLVMIFQWIPVQAVYADSGTSLTAGAAHSEYIGNSDSVLSNYGKGNYLYSTLTVTGDELDSEQVFSVLDLETMAYDSGSDLGYEGDYSFKNSGGTYSCQTMTGIKLYDFLVDECGLSTDSSDVPDDTPVKFIAKDGYVITATVADLKSTGYSYFEEGSSAASATGLPVLISFGSNGLPLVGPTGDESVSKSFSADEGYSSSAQNGGGPLKITIGQTDSDDYNAMLNSKWISRIVIGDEPYYARHSGSELDEQALTVKVYEGSTTSLSKTKTYTLDDLESFAAASSANMAKNYYADGDYYEGVNLWKLISGDTDLALSSFSGNALLKYGTGDTETISLSYLQNAGGDYSNYITEKDGSTITCVKPILAYGKNGAPTSDNAVYACLPEDGTYKNTGTVENCTEICLYTGTQNDTHNHSPYSDYINQTIEVTGSGIKNPASVSVGEIEQNISLMYSGQYTHDSQLATYGGISLYSFLQSKKLTVDADEVRISNGTEQIAVSLSALKADADDGMLAFSKNELALVPDSASAGYDATAGNSGGPLLFVSSSQYLANITSIEVTIKDGQWNHFDSNPSGYESYLDTTTIRIHGSQSKKDETITLRDLESMSGSIVRDSFAASKGCYGFEGVVLKDIISSYLISGTSKPTKITVVGSGGYEKELNVSDVYNGIESLYQSGETRDVILAYGVDGVPLVPSTSSIGYNASAQNENGPVKLIVENTISAWVKGVSEIVIGSADSENVDYTVSYYQTKARSGNADQQVPGLSYSSKTFSGTVGSSVEITPPDVPGWVFAGYNDGSGVYHRASGGAVSVTLSAVETENNIVLRYNVNAGFLIAGSGLNRNYWYSYDDLLDMAEKACDYSTLNADNYYSVNLYSVIKRGGVPANMFGAGFDLSKLLAEIGGSGSQKVTLYAADGGTSYYGGSTNLFNFSTGSYTDQGYYYYPEVLANGASAATTGQTQVLPVLGFKIKDISWIYDSLDDKGAPTTSSQLTYKPTLAADVQPVKDGLNLSTESITAWDDAPAYPYPTLMTGQNSPSHFNNTDFTKMIHGIAVGNMDNKLTITSSGVTLKAYDPMTFVKNGFEAIPFSTNREGISLSRLLSLSGKTLGTKETVAFTNQASTVANATKTTIGNYYLALNIDTSTNVLDMTNPFVLIYKNGSSVETAVTGGLSITASSDSDSDSGSGGGAGGEETDTGGSDIPWVDLIVEKQSQDEDSATSVRTVKAVIGESGTASADVRTQDISEPLKEVLALRKSAGTNVTAEVRLQINSDKGANKLTINLPASSLKDIAAQEKTQLTLETEIGEIRLTGELLGQLLRQAGGAELSVGITMLPEGALPGNIDPDQYPRGFYDLSLSSDGKPITNFGDNQITVGLPYKLAADEEAAGVFVYYIDDKGNPTVVLNSVYDKKTGMVVFQTGHFSYYAVGYDENVIQQVFKDVSAKYWAASAIGYVSGKGLFQGTSDSSFAPQGSMTRGMFVTVLARLGNVNATGSAVNFSDIKQGQWYADSVNWAAGAKIVEGYADNTFGPDQLVNREQMAAFLYRYAKWAGYDVKVASSAGISSFSDSGKVSSWAKDAMSWAVDRGLMSGVTATSLDPRGQATRAQVAVIAQRFCDKVVPAGAVVNSASSSSGSGGSSDSSGGTGKYAEVPSAKPYLTIKGSGVNNTIYLSYSDLSRMDKVTIVYTGRNKENNNKRQYLSFTGVNLATILNEAGWNGTGKTIRVTCKDGYTKKYDISELLNDYVSFSDDSDTSGFWVPPIVALIDGDTFRLVYGQEKTDTDSTMSFNMQGWANYLETIEID